MNLDQLKDRLFEQLKGTWGRIQESSAYEKMMERYHELPPTGQKVALIGSVLFSVLLILLIPFASFQTSSENVAQFEENVQALRDLFRVQRELASAPQVDDPPGPAQLQSMVQDVLTQAGLSADQIKGNSPLSPQRDPSNAFIPANVMEQGVEVTLMKLNLKQVVDLGSRLSQLGRNIHLTAMDMKASSTDVHYYDVIYRVMGFTINTPMPESKAPTKDSIKPGSKGDEA